METVLLSSGRRNPKDLRPHPLNDEIYGDRTDPDLIKSIEEKGVLSPLLITHDNRIISGHRRWGSALAINLETVPVVIFGSTNELDIEEALIESNRQRAKTNEQIGREYTRLSQIINERQSKQGTRNDIELLDTSLSVDKEVKPPTHQAAKNIGVGVTTANKAAAVIKVIDKLKDEGKTSQAEQVRKKLNTSVNGAYNQAKMEGILLDSKPKPAPQIVGSITLAEWNKINPAHQATLLNTQNSKAKFNETNDNVEWALWTWNPVTGCLHNCPYCYARDIANRFYTHLADNERFAPVFYPERLSAPAHTRQPELSNIENPIRRMGLGNVFVCSMADLFGKWVPTEWIEAVLQQAWDNPQWNFLFLTKFPIRMAEFEYPPNTWIGTTVDTQYAVERAEKAFTKVRASGYKGVAWLSCEPMMEKLTFTSLEMFDWVVMGGASKSTQTQEFRPPFDWIVHLWMQAKALDLPVYMKTNLWLDDAHKGIEVPNRVREYPRRAPVAPTAQVVQRSLALPIPI
jgi:protein gp37/ParB-like chromosome segregation protein Spo0J